MLFELHEELKLTHNLRKGVSGETEKVVQRIDHPRETYARVKLLSFELLIGLLNNLKLNNNDWVIAGGESGNRPRHMKADWVLDIQDQFERAGVAVFFKQCGGIEK